MRSKVKEMTQLDITTFQGAYEGKHFVIDGMQGKVSNLETTDSATPTDATSSTTTSEFTDTPIVTGDRKTVEGYVRKLFEIELQEKQKRIDQIEADLRRVKEKYAKRKADAEKIIQERVDALLSKRNPRSFPLPANPMRAIKKIQ